MSRESCLMQLSHKIDQIYEKNTILTFDIEIKGKDEYYFNEVLKSYRDKMNTASKNLNNEEIRKQKLIKEMKVYHNKLKSIELEMLDR